LTLDLINLSSLLKEKKECVIQIDENEEIHDNKKNETGEEVCVKKITNAFKSIHVLINTHVHI